MTSDYHTHTMWSDGSSTVEEIVGVATLRGIKRIGITDHFRKIKSVKNYIEEIRGQKGIEILVGTEIRWKNLKHLAEEERLDILNDFDYILVERLKPKNQEELNSLLEKIKPKVGLAHPDYTKDFDFLDESISLELNQKKLYRRNKEVSGELKEKIRRYTKKHQFTLGSDAHKPKYVGIIRLVGKLAQELGCELREF